MTSEDPIPLDQDPTQSWIGVAHSGGGYVLLILLHTCKKMQPKGGQGGRGAFSSFFMLASKLLNLPAHLYVYNVHVVVHDCTVIIIHVHVPGPVDGSKRHIFQLIFPFILNF